VCWPPWCTAHASYQFWVLPRRACCRKTYLLIYKLFKFRRCAAGQDKKLCQFCSFQKLCWPSCCCCMGPTLGDSNVMQAFKLQQTGPELVKMQLRHALLLAARLPAVNGCLLQINQVVSSQ
jgi:hypothetical protein